MKKVLVVMGTRPEAIKMGWLTCLIQKSKRLQVEVCVTAQHREMLDSALEIFDIHPDHDLNVMRDNHDLVEIAGKILLGMRAVIQTTKPDLVLVHGDTTTTFASALAAFYEHCPIGHVEAGLRTGNLDAPWPEEFNRRVVDLVAQYLFAPTDGAAKHLLAEGVPPDRIFVTGNTVIDSLQQIHRRIQAEPKLESQLAGNFPYLCDDQPLILVTLHRRENQGEGIQNVCKAIKEIARQKKTVFILPVHPNPAVSGSIRESLSGIQNIHLEPPLDYMSFVYLMGKCRLIITDSGGIQEEAPALGKPVLVTRQVTERPEAVEAGVARLVGSDTEGICNHTLQLLEDQAAYQAMASIRNPFGDGRACERIRDIIETI